jgi:nucleotide-binding universal stress UspA family protein
MLKNRPFSDLKLPGEWSVEMVKRLSTMKFHILVTISDDVRHLFGVRFLCSFFNNLAENYQITLLHISSSDRNEINRALGSMWSRPGRTVDFQLTAGARNAINTSRELLLNRQMVEQQIQTKTCAEHYGKTRDILQEGEAGQYDAIILGRRASYALQWMFENPADETAQTIVRDLCSIPVWICPELDKDRKNVLICIDGSDNSLRAVDHVGYILAPEVHQSVTLFHVESADKAEHADIFAPAEAILKDHGINTSRISRQSVRRRNVPATIHAEVNRGKYGAVALGFHGENEREKEKLAGSTITKLISNMEKAAIWCCT